MNIDEKRGTTRITVMVLEVIDTTKGRKMCEKLAHFAAENPEYMVLCKTLIEDTDYLYLCHNPDLLSSQFVFANEPSSHTYTSGKWRGRLLAWLAQTTIDLMFIVVDRAFCIHQCQIYSTLLGVKERHPDLTIGSLEYTDPIPLSTSPDSLQTAAEYDQWVLVNYGEAPVGHRELLPPPRGLFDDTAETLALQKRFITL